MRLLAGSLCATCPHLLSPCPFGKLFKTDTFQSVQLSQRFQRLAGMIYSCHVLSAGEQKTVHPRHKSTLALFLQSYDCACQVSYIVIFKSLLSGTRTKTHYYLAIF